MGKLYVSLQLYCWAILWEYLWRHISYHGNAQGPQKRPLNFSFCKLSEKLIRWPTIFISLLESSLNSLTFQTVWKKYIFRDLFFRLLLLFLSMHNSSLHQRLFQNLRHILNLRTFIVFCGGLLGGHLKKDYSVVFFFFSSHIDFCFLFHWTLIVFYQIIFQHRICWPLC